jgi:GDP-L-fucose synthase
MAEASVFLMELDKNLLDRFLTPMQAHINVGYGSDISIGELAKTIANVVGYYGKISFDQSKPDGSPQKLIDSSKLNQLGWKPSTDLRSGLRETYESFCKL